MTPTGPTRFAETLPRRTSDRVRMRQWDFAPAEESCESAHQAASQHHHWITFERTGRSGSTRDREGSGDVGATDSVDRYEAYRRASGVVGRSQLLGIVALLLFAVQAGTFVTFLSVFGVGLMIGASAFAVGGLVGFVFGIPRSLQEPLATPSTPAPDPAEPGAEVASQRARYAGNTSLEQISDWLTGILVGVGLTQLANIPSALSSLGETFAPALGGFAASPVVGPLEVVFFGTSSSSSATCGRGFALDPSSLRRTMR